MKIAIIGAGKWGSALFHALSQKNDCVISSRRQLEGAHFVGLEEALKRDLLVVAIPSQSVSGWLKHWTENFSRLKRHRDFKPSFFRRDLRTARRCGKFGLFIGPEFC